MEHLRVPALLAVSRRALLPAALGITAAGLVLLRQTEFGPGLTPDSASYLSTARSLSGDAGHAPSFGQYDAGRAPLFPLILAVANILRHDLIAATATLNAVAFGLSVFATAAWLRHRRVSLPLVVWAGLALALSPAAGAAAYVWSESVFVLSVLAALFSLHRFLVTGTRRALLVAAGFAALCCLARYPGATVLVCATALIAARTQWRPTKRIRSAVLYAAVGAAPTGLWLLRNLLVEGWFAGDWASFDYPKLGTFHMLVDALLGTTVGPTVLDGIDGVSEWFGVAADQPTAAGAVTKLAWLLAVWGLVAGALLRWRPVAFAAAAPAGFLLCYLALFGAASAVGRLDAEWRFIAPVNAPMLLILTLTFQAAASRLGAIGPGRWRRGFAATAMAAALSLWLAQWVPANIADVRQWRTHGSDVYGARHWAESATVARWKSHPPDSPDGLLLSNDPFAAYLLLDDGATSHRRGSHRTWHLPGKIAPKTVVVWFYGNRLREPANLMAFLGKFPRMGVIATLADGVIFQQGEETDAADAAARLVEALLRDARKGGIVATSHFDVYFGGAGNLMYVKHGCQAHDIRPRFFLHVTPKDPANLPSRRTKIPWRSAVSMDFHNLDFTAVSSGVRHGDVCIVTQALPSYAIAEIRTGQWSPGPRGEIWNTRFQLPPNLPRQGDTVR